MFSVDVFSIDDLIAELLDDELYRIDPIVTYRFELDEGDFDGFDPVVGGEG